MPLDERRARHGSMVKVLSENDIKDWGTRFIAALIAARAGGRRAAAGRVTPRSYLAAAE